MSCTTCTFPPTRSYPVGRCVGFRLLKPVPVLILYWTIDRDDQGEVLFKPDPYGRDPKLLKALDRPFLRPSEQR
jgi:murein L,D-transpeptidase YcbB/YkuD